ncbi:MAG: homoserine kinase [Bacteroidota bacterium]
MSAVGPASLSNLGPGFDALGLAITGFCDTVLLTRRDEPGVAVEATRIGDRCGTLVAADLPTCDQQNTAARAARLVLEAHRAEFGATMVIEKGIPLGSGIGGSAASAVAGAVAAAALLEAEGVVEAPVTEAALVEAVLNAESVASGGRHGDNVLPALLGGLVLVDSAEPTRFRRIPGPTPALALALPQVKVLTKAAREALPTAVPLRDAVCNAAHLAFLLDAWRAGDWAEVGRAMMTDRLAEPVRAPLVPGYAAIRDAALDTGALGCCLSGSGPAMVAVCRDAAHAATVASAMHAACQAAGYDAWAGAIDVDTDGGRAERHRTEG